MAVSQKSCNFAPLSIINVRNNAAKVAKIDVKTTKSDKKMKKMTAGDYATPKTLGELYRDLDPTPPKTKFVRELAELCMCSEQTVRMWIQGVQRPDALKQKLISEKLGVPATELFPVEEQAGENSTEE